MFFFVCVNCKNVSAFYIIMMVSVTAIHQERIKHSDEQQNCCRRSKWENLFLESRINTCLSLLFSLHTISTIVSAIEFLFCFSKTSPKNDRDYSGLALAHMTIKKRIRSFVFYDSGRTFFLMDYLIF